MIVALIASQDLSRNHLESPYGRVFQLHTYLIMSSCNVTQHTLQNPRRQKYLNHQLT